MNQSTPNDNLSDFGILNKDACDPMLRSRVITTTNPGDRQSVELTTDQLAELATYINQLEDALLRYHWGNTDSHQINELLKCSTGLDIEARASELTAMAASDA